MKPKQEPELSELDPLSPHWLESVRDSSPELWEARRAWIKDVNAYFRFYSAQIAEAVTRVTALIDAAAKVDTSKDDILRAAVVLTHAYLEDFLRTIIGELLPWGDETALNEVPIAGTTGRANKFPLSRLAQFRGRLVDEIIYQSVAEYLEKSTFNSNTEIIALLESAGLAVDEALKQNLNVLQAMIQRRHLIVHRADRVKVVGSGVLMPQAIEEAQVRQWVETTRISMDSLVVPVVEKKVPPWPVT